ncbi:MAG TPA: hypothetical protein VN238_16150 [Solirubrobacteraceae bacterium]|nr:hypothetical protein [Solirubrobacteraceae bacterium]
MHKISIVVAALAATVGLLGTASAASAAGLSGPASFTSSNAGLPAHEFTFVNGNMRFTCAAVSGPGTINPAPVDASGDPQTASVDPSFSNCRWHIVGTSVSATVTDTCTWTLAITGFTAPGTSTGTFGPNCTVAIRPPGNCVITFQPFSGQVTGQNLTSPTRLRATTTTATNIPWTAVGSDCANFGSAGTDGRYTGTLDHAGLQAVA